MIFSIRERTHQLRLLEMKVIFCEYFDIATCTGIHDTTCLMERRIKYGLVTDHGNKYW